jgi:hypothetical protein
MCWNVAIWAVLKSPVSWFFLLGGYTTLYMLGVYHKIGIPMTPHLWYCEWQGCRKAQGTGHAFTHSKPCPSSFQTLPAAA